MSYDKLRLAAGFSLAAVGGYAAGRWGGDVASFLDLMKGVELRADWAVSLRTAALTFLGAGVTASAAINVSEPGEVHKERSVITTLSLVATPFLAAGLGYAIHNTSLIENWQKSQKVSEEVCQEQKSGTIMPLTTRDGRKLVVECP